VLLAGKDIVRLVMREAVSCSVLECPQLPHWQLTLVLSFEDLRGLLGKYMMNKSYVPRGFPSKPLFPPTFLNGPGGKRVDWNGQGVGGLDWEGEWERVGEKVECDRRE
jgi:hypothetical protein